MVKTAWEREEVSFMLVAATVLLGHKLFSYSCGNCQMNLGVVSGRKITIYRSGQITELDV